MDDMILYDWLSQAVDQSASDLHLVPGYRPTLRLHGKLVEMDAPILTGEQTKSMLSPICPQPLRSKFEEQHNIDFALQFESAKEPRRFRVNLFVSDQKMGGCFRVIVSQIPNFEWAGFPRELAERLAHERNGLILVTGVTGAGKTTTLAMIVNLLNQEGGYRIITAEEPIEYVFPANNQSIVTQREVGKDIQSFADGLKYGLRQDPDVILVGEIRDQETAQMALSAAETGHLVFSTLHTRDAKGAISRFVDLFPQTVQNEIRAQLSLSLRAVISQHLLPSVVEGEKRELALEIMFNNSPVASAIRFGKVETIDTNIQMGKGDGMQSLNDSIRQLLHAGAISTTTAERFVTDKRYLQR